MIKKKINRISAAFFFFFYWKGNFPMNPHVNLLVCRLVGPSIGRLVGQSVVIRAGSYTSMLLSDDLFRLREAVNQFITYSMKNTSIYRSL